MSPEQQQPAPQDKAQRVFTNCIELPPAQRMTYLRTTCSTEPDVFEQVLRLLEAHDQTAAGPAQHSRSIGRYTISGVLGCGGMGTVYSAVDPLIARKVALKTINVYKLPSGDPGGLREKLFREAKLAGALSHPNIVTIYDLGESDEAPFIAMEFVDGQSLDKLLATQTRLPIPKVLDLLRQTAAGLDFAHQNGVVHRDIKPANLMLQPNGTVKIADFGIAKIQATGDTATKSTTIMGTVEYMSPEQITGAPADGKSDQFSLAVVAYQLLTGDLPFKAETTYGIQTAILSSPPRSVQAANPTLNSTLDEPIRRATEKSPENRFPTCLDFVSQLEQRATGIPAPVSQTTTQPTAVLPPPPKPTPKWPLAAGGVLLLALLSVAAYFTLRPANHAPTTAAPAASAPPPAASLRNAKQLYLDGIALLQTQPSSAAELLKQSAELGNRQAMFELGSMYFNGLGVPRDPATAAKWLGPAAEGGNPRAMVLLANMYAQGAGVPQNLTEARRLYTRAASLGNAEARSRLTRLDHPSQPAP